MTSFPSPTGKTRSASISVLWSAPTQPDGAGSVQYSGVSIQLPVGQVGMTALGGSFNSTPGVGEGEAIGPSSDLAFSGEMEEWCDAAGDEVFYFELPIGNWSLDVGAEYTKSFAFPAAGMRTAADLSASMESPTYVWLQCGIAVGGGVVGATVSGAIDGVAISCPPFAYDLSALPSGTGGPYPGGVTIGSAVTLVLAAAGIAIPADGIYPPGSSATGGDWLLGYYGILFSKPVTFTVAAYACNLDQPGSASLSLAFDLPDNDAPPLGTNNASSMAFACAPGSSQVVTRTRCLAGFVGSDPSSFWTPEMAGGATLQVSQWDQAACSWGTAAVFRPFPSYEALTIAAPTNPPSIGDVQTVDSSAVLTATWNMLQVSAGYRRLRIPMSGFSAPQYVQVSVSATSPAYEFTERLSWNFVADGASDLVIDLCVPPIAPSASQSEIANGPGEDSRLTLWAANPPQAKYTPFLLGTTTAYGLEFSLYDLPYLSGPWWGLNVIEGITVTVPAGTGAYHIGPLTLEYSSAALYLTSNNPIESGFEAIDYSGSTASYGRLLAGVATRRLLGSCDECTGLELFDQPFVSPFGLVGSRTLESAASEATARGWPATAADVSGDATKTADLATVQEIFWDSGAAPSGQFASALPANLRGQQTYASLSTYADGPSTLFATVVTGSMVHGLAVDRDGTYLASEPVSFVPGTSATITADGQYREAPPYGSSVAEPTAISIGSAVVELATAAVGVRRIILVLPANMAGSATGYDVAADLRHVCISPGFSGLLTLAVGGNGAVPAWVDQVTQLRGSWGRVRFEDQGPVAGIGVLHGNGVSLSWARTLDHGNSFQEVTDMGSGSFGDYEEGANGLKWDFKLVANAGGGYDLWSQMRDAELAVVRPWQITTLTGIDNAPISARESYTSDGAWRIGVAYFVGGVFTVKYAPDGLNFD